MKIVKWILAGVSTLMVIGAIGLAVWGLDAYQPTKAALDALQSDDHVNVVMHDGYITFEPLGQQPVTGFVFVPGGRVDYRAYTPVLHQIAAQGFFVAIVKVHINLAFFDINAPDRVIPLYPDIQHWVIGGHSLGGVAAARYAEKHLDALEGIVFWASYPPDSALASSDLKVLSIYGTNDMAGVKAFETSRTLLPGDAQFVTIPGGNHAQFGAYGVQAGDNVATITAEDQWAQTVKATANFLANMNQ